MTVVLGAWAWLANPNEVRALVAHKRNSLVLNATTAPLAVEVMRALGPNFI